MNELYELAERHVSGESTPEENARLHALLQDRNTRSMFVRHVTLMATVRGICKATDQEVAEVRSMTGEVPVRGRTRAVSRILALAASLAIIAGGIIWWFIPAAPLGVRVAEIQGSGVRVQGTGWRTAAGVVGLELRRGDRVVVPEGGKAVLKYDGEATTLALHSGTATLGADSGAKRVKLASGLLVCTVAPQAKPFLLKTHEARAEVIGTSFFLAVAGTETSLSVKEGKVALTRGNRNLPITAGMTAVASKEGLRPLSPGDAWLRELLVRAETGPWDVLNLGTGVVSGDVWRMDARGGPAERRIWNTPIELDRTGLLSFRDGKRWARGVVIGRMRLLPDGRLPSEVAGVEMATNIPWKTYRFRLPDAPADWQTSRRASVTLTFGPRERERNDGSVILDAVEHQAGVWYRYAVYFDTETPDGLRSVIAAWPVGAAPPPGSAWLSHRDERTGKDQVEIGLMAKGVLIEAQGLKFVPLGADMPLPPKELFHGKTEINGGRSHE